MEAIRRLDETSRGDARLAADVVVGGAGVSGLAVAFRAAKAGRRVPVVEREPGRVGGGLHSRRPGEWARVERGGRARLETAPPRVGARRTSP